MSLRIILQLGLVALNLAAAEEANLDRTAFHRFETAKMLRWAEDTLYIPGENGLCQWKAGMAEPAEILSPTGNAAYFYMQECPEDEQEASLWKNAIQMIFTDKQQSGVLWTVELKPCRLATAWRLPLRCSSRGKIGAFAELGA